MRKWIVLATMAACTGETEPAPVVEDTDSDTVVTGVFDTAPRDTWSFDSSPQWGGGGGGWGDDTGIGWIDDPTLLFQTRPCTGDDIYEDNETPETATDWSSPVTLEAYACRESVKGVGWDFDTDLYAIPAAPGASYTIDLEFNENAIDLDLLLLWDGVVVSKSWSGNNDESASWTAPDTWTGDGTLLVAVISFEGAGDYTLSRTETGVPVDTSPDTEVETAAPGSIETAETGNDVDSDAPDTGDVADSSQPDTGLP